MARDYERILPVTHTPTPKAQSVFWITYNRAYNIDSVYSMEPDLNSNQFSNIAKIIKAREVIEPDPLEAAQLRIGELEANVNELCDDLRDCANYIDPRKDRDDFNRLRAENARFREALDIVRDVAHQKSAIWGIVNGALKNEANPKQEAVELLQNTNRKLIENNDYLEAENARLRAGLSKISRVKYGLEGNESKGFLAEYWAKRALEYEYIAREALKKVEVGER